MPSKIVIVLGAGFSCGAELPPQHDLMRKLQEYGIRTTGPRFGIFRKFFQDAIGDELQDYLIEDVFTILDQSLSSNEVFKGHELALLDSLNRSLLLFLRSFLLDEVKIAFSSRKYSYKSYVKLANEILKARERYGSTDQLAIISMNWDHYFEKVRTSRLTNHQEVSLDYCTYDY